jgi:hypothetical protein
MSSSTVTACRYPDSTPSLCTSTLDRRHRGWLLGRSRHAPETGRHDWMVASGDAIIALRS